MAFIDRLSPLLSLVYLVVHIYALGDVESRIATETFQPKSYQCARAYSHIQDGKVEVPDCTFSSKVEPGMKETHATAEVVPRDRKGLGTTDM